MKNDFFQYYKPSILVSFLVVIGILLYLGNNYISTHWGVSVAVVSLITTLIILINKHLWNIRPFSLMFWSIDISGDYEGEIEYKDVVSKELTKRKVFIKVFQNGSSIQLHSTFGENGSSDVSQSKSLSTSFIMDEFGNYELIFTFRNEGNQHLQFSPYYGTNIFTVNRINGKVVGLDGEYYTNREPTQTKGKIKVEYISKK